MNIFLLTLYSHYLVLFYYYMYSIKYICKPKIITSLLCFLYHPFPLMHHYHKTFLLLDRSSSYIVLFRILCFLNQVNNYILILWKGSRTSLFPPQCSCVLSKTTQSPFFFIEIHIFTIIFLCHNFIVNMVKHRNFYFLKGFDFFTQSFLFSMRSTFSMLS